MFLCSQAVHYLPAFYLFHEYGSIPMGANETIQSLNHMNKDQKQ